MSQGCLVTNALPLEIPVGLVFTNRCTGSCRIRHPPDEPSDDVLRVLPDSVRLLTPQTDVSALRRVLFLRVVNDQFTVGEFADPERGGCHVETIQSIGTEISVVLIVVCVADEQITALIPEEGDIVFEDAPNQRVVDGRILVRE